MTSHFFRFRLKITAQQKTIQRKHQFTMASTASTAAMKVATSSRQRILQTYRTMLGMIEQLPESKADSFRKEIRTKFRVPLDAEQDEQHALDDRLREAGEKIAFLRIITPKQMHVVDDADPAGGRWVYRDGEAIEDGESTIVDGRRVISSFQGHNMDPCMVKRHNQSLKRAGFNNNLHAKGIF